MACVLRSNAPLRLGEGASRGRGAGDCYSGRGSLVLPARGQVLLQDQAEDRPKRSRMASDAPVSRLDPRLQVSALSLLEVSPG